MWSYPDVVPVPSKFFARQVCNVIFTWGFFQLLAVVFSSRGLFCGCLIEQGYMGLVVSYRTCC